MQTKSPCYTCTERFPACWGKCETFKEWQAKTTEEHHALNNDKYTLDTMYDYGGKWHKQYYRPRRKRGR